MECLKTNDTLIGFMFGVSVIGLLWWLSLYRFENAVKRQNERNAARQRHPSNVTDGHVRVHPALYDQDQES